MQGIAELRSLAQKQYDESVRRAPGHIRRIGDLNSRFHRALQVHSGSARLVAMLPALIDAPLVHKTFARYEDTELVRSASHHLEIVSALEARDGDWAASVMRSHIQAAHVSFKQIDRAGAASSARHRMTVITTHTNEDAPVNHRASLSLIVAATVPLFAPGRFRGAGKPGSGRRRGTCRRSWLRPDNVLKSWLTCRRPFRCSRLRIFARRASTGRRISLQ